MTICGKNIVMRTVNAEDAKFIYEIRQNKNKTKHLSKIDISLEAQKEYIKNYKIREKENKEFYFVIESKNKEKLGLVRMYDFVDDSFCWGSWIIKENAPKLTAIESALQIYEFGFYKLGFKQSHFDVRKENKKVIVFHQRFGTQIVGATELDYLFNYKKKDYEQIKGKYARYLK